VAVDLILKASDPDVESVFRDLDRESEAAAKVRLSVRIEEDDAEVPETTEIRVDLPLKVGSASPTAARTEAEALDPPCVTTTVTRGSQTPKAKVTPILEEEAISSSEPSPAVVRRLMGLNILRVMDVDGTGHIARDILKTSLMIFDPVLFTEEEVEKFLKAAFDSGAEDGGERSLRLLDLARYMGAPIFYPSPRPSDPGHLAEDSAASLLDMRVSSTEASMFRPGVVPIYRDPSSQVTVDSEATCVVEEFCLAVTEPTDAALHEGEALLTARTDVDSTANDLENARVVLADLVDGGDGCTIKNPELRGISLRQLKRLFHYIEEHCEREAWYDVETFEPLTPDTVDLFNLREWVLKPATEERRCSYVEVISAHPDRQCPVWHVSHGDGPVLEFIRCLSEHAERHGFSDDVAYWIGAYAMDPWEEDDGESAVDRSLAASMGTVHVIGDGPVAYLEVGSHSFADVDTDPFSGLRFKR